MLNQAARPRVSFRPRPPQSWAVGETVNVGFLRLRVLAKVATPGNWLPDQYALTNAAGDKFYRFVPHNGVTRMSSLADAMVPA